MTDLFETKRIIPMAPAVSEPFDSENYIYEIKFDGMRCIGYYNNCAALRNRTGKDITELYPELSEVYRQFREKCIIDSEIIILNNGKPDFSLLAQRWSLTSRMRIEQMSKKIPVTLVVFDILYYKDQSVMEMPLLERKELLEKNTVESGALAISRFIRGAGTELFRKAVSQELEGIVAKKNDGPYIQGRSKLWLKSKRKQDMDLLLCGYMNGHGFIFCDEQLRYRIALNNMDQRTYQQLLCYVEKNRINKSPLVLTPLKLNKAAWVKPELMCVVEYLEELESGQLRHAVFKGIKLDQP
jgi:bifunctional non-homologous end joining protein LigD/DNA ligase-1